MAQKIARKAGIETTKSGYWYRHSPAHKRVFLGQTAQELRDSLAKIERYEIGHDLLSTHKVDHLAKNLYRWMTARAQKRGMQVMSPEEFANLWKRADGRCEISGIKFSLRRVGNCRRRPWAPSVDRIDCSKGYEFDNCRLLCLATNLALNEFGDECLQELAEAIAFKPRRSRAA